MTLIVDCQTFPCICYIKKLIDSNYIKIEKYENFQKMSFRNRYMISRSNGVQDLTVPIVGGREQKTLITEVRIDNSADWQTKHWRSILSAYSKAPFFEYYSSDIKDLIFSKEEFLFSFNMNALSWLCKTLKINTIIEFTESYTLDCKDETDYRNYFLPKSFQHTRNQVPYYSQVFEPRIGFQPNLSIIDLILCEGPNSIELLNQT